LLHVRRFSHCPRPGYTGHSILRYDFVTLLFLPRICPRYYIWCLRTQPPAVVTRCHLVDSYDIGYNVAFYVAEWFVFYRTPVPPFRFLRSGGRLIYHITPTGCAVDVVPVAFYTVLFTFFTWTVYAPTLTALLPTLPFYAQHYLTFYLPHVLPRTRCR